MNNFKLLPIIAAMLATAILAGCASLTLVSLETDTVDGPKQVRQGEDIDPKSITVWGIYKNGDRKVVYISASSITFNKHTPGPQTVKIRVSSREASFQTEVMALRSLTVASPPRTVLFKQGQEPESGWPSLEIRGEWDQMGSEKIALASCEITGYMKDQAGKQTIKVSYEGLTTTFDVDVRSMTSIQITQPPTKLDYLQGEALVLTGLKVVGVWEGFPTEELAITRNDITGFNANNAGIQHITVTKNGRNASFDVEVMALTSIVVDKPPTKTNYKAGEPLDLTGIMVYGNYTGANPTKKKTELIPVNQLTVSGYEPNRIGNQQRVTVTVRGQNANFFVNIDQATAAAPPPQTTPPQTTPPQAPSTATEAQRVLAQAAYDARLREGGFDPYKPDNPADRIYQAVLNDKTGNPEQAGYDARVKEGGFDLGRPDNPGDRIYQAVLAAKNGQSTTTPAANPPSSSGR